jgi:carbon monoxide dehydrogenase subunit G
MEFSREISVAVPPEKVWAFLWDLDRMARCIPGCREAREIEPHKRYEALVSERVGPFKVQFPLDIDIVEAQAPARLRAVATGRDNSVGSSVKVRLDLDIVGDAGRTSLSIHADVSVLGKLAMLGHGVIKRKSDEIMTQFAESLRQALEDSRADAPAL